MLTSGSPASPTTSPPAEIADELLREDPDVSPQQRSIIAHHGGPLLVIAGPGLGKTLSLVLCTIKYPVNGPGQTQRIGGLHLHREGSIRTAGSDFRGEDARDLLEACGVSRTLQLVPLKNRFTWQQLREADGNNLGADWYNLALSYCTVESRHGATFPVRNPEIPPRT
jgi:hypothetical protein